MADAIDLTLLDTLRAQCVAANAKIATIAPPAPLPPPSGYTTTISNLERLSGWIQPGNVGNTGGGSSVPHGTYEMALGSAILPATVIIQPASAWDNFYLYRTLGNYPTATRFFLALEFQLPTAADLAACQAFEFELQQLTGGLVFNMAWQADLAGSKVWRYFDYGAKAWIATKIPVMIAAGEWISVVAQFTRTATTMTHTTIAINGAQMSVMATLNGVTAGGAGYLNCAFQGDTMGGNPPPGYKWNIQNYNVSFA